MPRANRNQAADPMATASQAAAHQHPGGPPPPADGMEFHHEDGEDDDAEDDEDGGSKSKTADKKSGRRKIKIEFINDKSRRHITFSKRKAGIMKKAYELSTLTGTQVLLLVVSETGLVYTFTTAKLQPLVTQPEGKNLIQACLNAPAGQVPTGAAIGQAGNTVHQAHISNVPPPPQMVPQPPVTRNMPGGIAIGGSEKHGAAKGEEDLDDDEEEGASAGEESPATHSHHPGMPQPQAGLQRHTSHHGGPGVQRTGASTAHSGHGAHHGSHPYGGAQNPAREAHRRRTTSDGSAGALPNAGQQGKVTSPRSGMQTRGTSGMGVAPDGGAGGMDGSPPVGHLPPQPGHEQLYGYAPTDVQQQQRMMAATQYSGQPPQAYASTGWGGMPAGQPVHGQHRR